jgi:D-alanine transaminase
LKTINLLPNVLAKQQAAAAGAFEAIMIRDGLVTEGASSNAYAVIGGALRTHPLTNRILAGITREVVLELAQELNVTVVEEPFTAADLRRASEVIITATTADVMPVVSVDNQPVGDGRVGPVARRLGAAFQARLERESAGAPAR